MPPFFYLYYKEIFVLVKLGYIYGENDDFYCIHLVYVNIRGKEKMKWNMVDEIQFLYYDYRVRNYLYGEKESSFCIRFRNRTLLSFYI